MLKRNFSAEEASLVAIYKEETDNLQLAIAKINEAMPYNDDEMKVLAKSALSKLNELTQQEFEETYFESLL